MALSREARARELRAQLEVDPDDPTSRSELERALAGLHALPEFRGLGDLVPSMHEYGSPMLLGDQAAITAHQRGMLLHGRPAQLLDVPSMRLSVQSKKPLEAKWAVYNPSVLPIKWRGRSALLATFRVSTWHLCSWEGRSSPIERLPMIDGRRTVTSKIYASILSDDFAVELPMHPVGGVKHKVHQCIHHQGMRRVGVDDGRLFELGGAPWMIFAAVALEGEPEFCFHHLMLCPLSLPSADPGADGGADGGAAAAADAAQVRCERKTVVRFDRADEVSAAARREGRLQNVHQKNWSPFVVGGQLFLVFAIEPLTILRVDTETGKCEQLSEASTPALQVMLSGAQADSFSTFGLHGGSAFIPLPAPFEGELLSIGRIHRGNTRYALFFHTVAAGSGGSDVGIPKSFAIARVSPLFCFASTSPAHAGLCETIQFAGGLVIQGDNLVVTYGVNDCEAKVAFLPLRRVFELLLPAKG